MIESKELPEHIIEAIRPFQKEGETFDVFPSQFFIDGEYYYYFTFHPQHHSLYQDYVCGCLLRAARDVFAILPVKVLYVHALSTWLNTATGHHEEGMIASVKITRKQIKAINFELVDCSDAIESMEHVMSFDMEQGFDWVEPLKP